MIILFSISRANPISSDSGIWLYIVKEVVKTKWDDFSRFRDQELDIF